MASLVCFPFKEEDVTVAVRNVEIAASHPSVSAVLGVGFSKGETWHAIETAAAGIEKRTGKRVILRLQRRIGMNLRGGKGDGMNTALQFFVEHREFERLHFYDADITSFSGEWISKAEKQADLDFDIVRHYFPRSSTDAMITWLVTKIGFALLWPNSVLPHIEQPLGGELLLTRRAAEVLVADHRVYVPEGKMHALYGGLRDLRTMLIECFSAVQSLKSEDLNDEGNPVIHRVEFARPVPEAVRSKVGYDVEKTLKLLKEPLTPRMKSSSIRLIMATEWPTWSFCDEEAWVAAYIRFLDTSRRGDADWEELLFRVWVARVLNHTIRNVMRGYDVALGALRELVADTQQRSAGQVRAEASNRMTLASGHTALEAKQDADASWTLMQADSDAVNAVNFSFLPRISPFRLPDSHSRSQYPLHTFAFPLPAPHFPFPPPRFAFPLSHIRVSPSRSPLPLPTSPFPLPAPRSLPLPAPPSPPPFPFPSRSRFPIPPSRFPFPLPLSLPPPPFLASSFPYPPPVSLSFLHLLPLDSPLPPLVYPPPASHVPPFSSFFAILPLIPPPPRSQAHFPPFSLPFPGCALIPPPPLSPSRFPPIHLLISSPSASYCPFAASHFRPFSLSFTPLLPLVSPPSPSRFPLPLSCPPFLLLIFPIRLISPSPPPLLKLTYPRSPS
ncbi:unnamed protein product [Closterium sp. NIES-64]|nr:unnamed protein product [Closterium sp. NIES-64]